MITYDDINFKQIKRLKYKSYQYLIEQLVY